MVSLAAAVVAALCYGVAAVMQAMAARAASRRSVRSAGSSALGNVDPGLVLRMLHQWRFIASLALDLVGFVAQLVALRRLPLFAVQAMIAANLAVTAVVAAWLIHLELSWREWLAVAGVVVGVGMLGSSAGQQVVTGVSAEFKLALILAVAGIALIGVAVLGFSLAVVCAVALARFGETDEQGLTAAQRRVRQAAEADPSPYTAS